MMKTILLCCFLACSAAFAREPAGARGKADRVVVLVWDGMRPDMITAERTPTLHALAKEGVFFGNHHSAYLTSTEVNGAALATGMHPAHGGVMANREYRRDIDPLRSFATEDPAAMRKGDASGGSYLTAQTVPEILQAAGLRTAVAGTKAVALLQDRRRADEPVGAEEKAAILYGPGTLGQPVGKALVESLGAFPAGAFPNSAQDDWTTRALTEIFWKEAVPEYSVLWLSEPDYSQHHTAPGSPLALEALRSSDARLAAVLAALEARGLRGSTDVMVVSDHGFSTVSRSVDVAAQLRDEGFSVWRGEFKQPPAPGDILVVGNGGSVLFYVAGPAAQTTRQLVESLQRSDFAGVIFTREKFEGTFPLAQVGINTASAPDVVVAMRWTKAPNEFGVSGSILGDAGRAGRGTHTTLSPFDLHNTLVAAGPDFARGMMNSAPTGNVDIAPTVLWILGVKPPKPMDGRVLVEAMPARSGEKPEVKHGRAQASRAFEGGRWEQSLKWSEVGGTRYFDEGNGAYAEEK